MTASNESLAVYTTIYPGAEQYLPAWYQSILSQTDSNFEVWVGLDTLTPREVSNALSTSPEFHYVTTPLGSTPASIRQQVLSKVVNACTVLVLSDCDDIMEPTRIAAARKHISNCDVTASSMTLLSENGEPLGQTFGTAQPDLSFDQIARENIFGLSNSTYRASSLKKCLPIPERCEVVDWYLATAAWACGAKLHFSATPELGYRQVPNSIALTTPPFSSSQVIAATERALKHYNLILSSSLPLLETKRRVLEEAFQRARRFHEIMTSSTDLFAFYIKELNALGTLPAWWACVANSELESLWSA